MFCADRLPHPLEDGGRAGEVDAGEVGVREHRVADLAARAEHHVDDARRQPRLLVDLHQEVGRVDGRRGRLEDDGVSHQRRRRRQVPGDRREVERRDGEDEALERAVLDPVPDARRGDRLLAHQPVHVGDVVAPEVGQLAGRVDLGLERGLRLAEHRGGVHRVAPRPGEQLGRPQEDRTRAPPTRAPTIRGGPRRRRRSPARPPPRRPGGTGPRTCWWSWGMTTSAVRPVRTSSPPITIGISICRPAISSRRALRLARSGEPGG